MSHQRVNAGFNRRRFLAAAPAFALPTWFSAHADPSIADVVLLNGEVHTVDQQDRRVEALALAAGRILAAGSSKDVERLVGPNTRLVDLDGRTVLPGINDSHLHLLNWAMSKPPFSLDVTYPNVKSIADCVDAVRRQTAERPPGEWIVGRGWDQPYLSEGRPPDAADLDVVSPDHPVALTEFSGHALWVNSKALEVAGIGDDTVPPPGGIIVRDAEGRATGLLFEGAAWMVSAGIPERSLDQRRAALKAGMQRMLARGVTSCTEPGLAPENLRLLNDVVAESFTGKLRVTALVMAGTSASSLSVALEGLAELAPAEQAWLKMPGVKIMGDGIPTGNKTAWLHEPYEGGGNGSLLLDGESVRERVAELNGMINMIHRAGLQIGTHVTGDRSIDTVIAAYKAAQKATPRKDPRHYIIHADLVSENTLAQMAGAGIGVNFNPEIKHLIADSQVQSLGPVRAAYEWPYRSALQAQVNVASSSDAPVTDGNWLQGLATCVDRRGKQSGEVSGPEQRITLDEAIRSYTWAGAWQDHAEQDKGSLEVGKVADICVLDERLSAVDSSRYSQVEVAMTIVDGKIVHG